MKQIMLVFSQYHGEIVQKLSIYSILLLSRWLRQQIEFPYISSLFVLPENLSDLIQWLSSLLQLVSKLHSESSLKLHLNQRFIFKIVILDWIHTGQSHGELYSTSWVELILCWSYFLFSLPEREERKQFHVSFWWPLLAIHFQGRDEI